MEGKYIFINVAYSSGSATALSSRNYGQIAPRVKQCGTEAHEKHVQISTSRLRMSVLLFTESKKEDHCQRVNSCQPAWREGCSFSHKNASRVSSKNPCWSEPVSNINKKCRLPEEMFLLLYVFNQPRFINQRTQRRGP